MPDHVDATMMIVAGTGVIGGVAVGLVLRTLFGRLANRDRSDSARRWRRFGWTLLRDTALPATVTAGVWWAAEAMQVGPPVRDVINRILLVVVVMAVVLAAARIAANIVAAIAAARSGDAETGPGQSATIFVNLTRVVVIAIGILVLLQSLGISITPMLTALGVGGLAVALALQDTLANLFAGVQILLSKKVQPGDFIRLDSGEEGYVVDINWRNTSVRQLAGNIIVIPNARLADAVLTNFHQPMQDMAVVLQVGVSYDSDLDHVEQVTIEVGREIMLSVEGAVPDHEPFIRYHTFGDHSIGFSVILRAKEFTAQFLIQHEFVKRLHRRYRAEGIEIPYPIRTLVTSNGRAQVGGARPTTALPLPRSETDAI